MKKPWIGAVLFRVLLFVTLLALCAPSFALSAAVAKRAPRETLYDKSDLPGLAFASDEGSLEKTDQAQIALLALTGVDETNEIKTFDEKKVFCGNAENGVTVSAAVYIPAAKGKWKKLKVYTSAVGASGIFNLSVDFGLGENYVVVSVAKDGKAVSQRLFTVWRKDSEIMDKLIEQPMVFNS